MSENTMQLAVVTPDRAANESAAETTGSTRWFQRPSKGRGRHRVWDELDRLKQKLSHSEQLNKELGDTLRDALDRNVELQEKIDELEEKLRVAEAANEANSHAVDFVFEQRQVDGPADEPTMPVPQAVLIADTALDEAERQIVAATAEAATAFLDRVVPSTRPRVAKPPMDLMPLPRDWAEAQLTPPITPVRPLEAAEVPEVNDVERVWNARPAEPGFPVTWGRKTAETLRASQSGTGTFRVVPLHSRDTGPDSIPGIAL